MRIWESPVEDGVTTFGLDAPVRAEILPGLPYAGTEYRDISERGEKLILAHLVVGFSSEDGVNWIGNFESGVGGGVDGVFHTFEPTKLLVVSGGRGYWVKSATEWDVAKAFPIRDIVVVHDVRSTFFADWSDIERFDSGQAHVWRERVVADDLVIDRVQSGVLAGRGYDGMGSEITYECDAVSGEVSYPPGTVAWWRDSR